jgi:hypothetical protein
MKTEQAIAKFCIAKGLEASTERIKIQAEYMRRQGFTDDQLVKAVGELFGETPFFPDASMVLKKLQPNSSEIQDEAQVVAGLIVDANTKFGHYDQKGVREHVGELAYYVIERFGGWASICNLQYSEMGTARAQLKKIAESAIRNKITGGKLEYSRQQAGEIKKLSRPNFLELVEGLDLE